MTAITVRSSVKETPGSFSSSQQLSLLQLKILTFLIRSESVNRATDKRKAPALQTIPTITLAHFSKPICCTTTKWIVNSEHGCAIPTVSAGTAVQEMHLIKRTNIYCLNSQKTLAPVWHDFVPFQQSVREQCKKCT